jgi:hypothetical protein
MTCPFHLLPYIESPTFMTRNQPEVGLKLDGLVPLNAQFAHPGSITN